MPHPLVQLGPPASVKWRNPHRRLPAVRWAVQALYAAFLVGVGIQFWRFHAQVTGGSVPTVARPPAVEAFLPISALVGLKRFVLTGQWDDVHPAGLTILVAAVVGSLVARKAFCSWVCPVGTISRALEWIGKKVLWRSRRPSVPRWVDLPLMSVKYLLLAFFAWLILVQMPIEAIDGFMHAPYNVAADAKMLLFFGDLSTTAAVVLVALAALSLIVKHFWCRYLCPYGALLGIASLFSPQRVVRDPATCNDCQACTRACPVEIQVHARGSVWTSECTGCLSCVAACTVPDCLTTTRRGKRGLTPWLVPAGILGVMLGAWLLAWSTGHWETSVPLRTLMRAYQLAPLLSH